jgi:tRNA(His) 5'-end guanylyltransferase
MGMDVTKDALGDRMKLYEQIEAGRAAIPRLPILVRIDGKGFSSWTKGLGRPYDSRLSELMIQTTEFLVTETCANLGYTQSDEISLVFLPGNEDSQTYFGGKFQKLTSVLASYTTAFFNSKVAEHIPEKRSKLAIFDCRVWVVPSLVEAANAFVWRELDATKNSISMAAMEYYSHKELFKKSGKEKQEMLFQKGINWNDYPVHFKRGTYVRRETYSLDNESVRTRIVRPEIEPISKVPNKIEVLFGLNNDPG